MKIISAVKSGADETRRVKRLFLYTFLAAFVIMLIAFATEKVYPFGDRQMLVIDARDQYYPFMLNMQQRMRGVGSMLYTRDVGLGMNFWSLMAYYAFSPLNLLLVLVPSALLREFMMVITAVKIGLAASFMAILVAHLRPTLLKKSYVYPMLFGLAYAFSTYLMGYYWCIIWLDSIALLPLVILGLYRMLEGGSPYLYTVSLGVAILSSFYIGFIICMFIAFYYFYAYYVHRERHGRKGKRAFFGMTGKVILYSAVGILLSGIVLFPAYKAVNLSSAGNIKFPKVTDITNSFNFVVDRMMPMSKPVKLDLYGAPNIAAGAFSLYAIYLYFRSKKVPVAEKSLSLLIVLFFFLGFTTKILNFIWHGFHFPNGIPFRNAFALVFFILVLGATGYSYLSGEDRPRLHVFVAIAIGYIVLMENKDAGEKYIAAIPAIIAVITIVLFSTVLDYILKPDCSKKRGLAIALSVFVALETLGLAVFGVKSTGTSSYSGYIIKQEEIQAALSEMRQRDGGIYRTEMSRRYTTNDSSLYGYRGISNFASTMNSKVTSFICHLGAAGKVEANRYFITMESPVIDSLFNVKYFIARGELDYAEHRGYKELWRQGDISLVQNGYALPFGFYVDPKTVEYASNSENPFEAQEEIYSKMLGRDFSCYEYLDLAKFDSSQEQVGSIVYKFDKMSAEYDDKEHEFSVSTQGTGSEGKALFSISIPDDGDYFVYFYASNQEDVTIKHLYNSADKKKSYSYESRRGIIVPSGRMSKGDVIELETKIPKKTKGAIRIAAVKIDYNAFEKANEELAMHPFEVTKFKDTKIEGKIDAPRDGYMYLSLPYEKGWTVKVNGQKIESDSMEEAMYLIPVKAGTNNISMGYIPAGFVSGLFLTILGAAILFMPRIISLIKKKKH